MSTETTTKIFSGSVGDFSVNELEDDRDFEFPVQVKTKNAVFQLSYVHINTSDVGEDDEEESSLEYRTDLWDGFLVTVTPFADIIECSIDFEHSTRKTSYSDAVASDFVKFILNEAEDIASDIGFDSEEYITNELETSEESETQLRNIALDRFRQIILESDFSKLYPKFKVS